jgi:hypothetical protein
MFCQLVPAKESNIEFLATFGSNAKGTWGDDDHTQVFFISLSNTQKDPFYIRIYDPECGGKNDQINTAFNTQTKFTVYGGNDCYSNKDARQVNPSGNYKSGIQLGSKTFNNETIYDDKWYTFGPFNPQEGELDKELNGYVFKLIIEGISGDDGNMYKFFVSTQADNNYAPEGTNAFAYEMCFRINAQSPNALAHLYPFIDKNVLSVRQYNFDFDSDGEIRLTTIAKKLHPQAISKDGTWEWSANKVKDEEKNTSFDLQISKKGAKSNDMVMYMVNQYNEAVPFFSNPIGGKPKYKYKIDVQVKQEK